MCKKVWRGPRPSARDGDSAAGAAGWHVIPGPVEGLFICHDFLSIEEVEVLRTLFKAQNGWSMYNWGNVGKRNELASVLQRIDFGMPEMTAEGVAAARCALAAPLPPSPATTLAGRAGRAATPLTCRATSHGRTALEVAVRPTGL